MKLVIAVSILHFPGTWKKTSQVCSRLPSHIIYAHWVKDDVLEIGLMFRFVTDHPSTMQNVSVVFDFLEKINGKKPRALV